MGGRNANVGELHMNQLTPSALLLLHADQWTGPTAGAPQVAEMLLAAAFLANEAEQAMELEMTPGQGLALHPGEKVPDWPAGSLEFTLWTMVAAGGSCVSDMVYDLLKETPPAAQSVVRYVASALPGAPAEVERLAAVNPLEQVGALLHRTSQERPALWAELFDEIRIGLNLAR